LFTEIIAAAKKRGEVMSASKNIRGKSFLEQSKSGKGSPCACGSIGRFEPAIWETRKRQYTEAHCQWVRAFAAYSKFDSVSSQQLKAVWPF